MERACRNNAGLNVYGPCKDGKIDTWALGTYGNHPFIPILNGGTPGNFSQYNRYRRVSYINTLMPQIDGQLIAFGDMGDNADLSSPITLYLNRLGVGRDAGHKGWFGPHGFTEQSVGHYQTKQSTKSAWFGTGKFGDLFFQNVPLYCFGIGHQQNGHQYEDRIDLQPGWVIQPTALGEAQVNEFAITAYEPKYRNTIPTYTTTSTRQYNGYPLCVPRADEAFQFALLSGFSA